jgi:hypothetical protein
MRCIPSVLAALLIPSVIFAQDPATLPAARDAEAAYRWNLEKFKDSPDHLVLPGLLADRRAKQVRIWGRASGLEPGQALEFVLLSPGSGKDYEALCGSYAKAQDVHRALEFIGMKPGEPVDLRVYRSWPKGERVNITFHFQGTSVPAEEMVIDTRTNKPLPREGWVFVGSMTLKPEDTQEELYAADVMDPRSIASTYNEPTTVLDVPYRWSQGGVYGFIQINPKYKLEAGAPMEITLEPQRKEDGPPRVREMVLKVQAPADPGDPLEKATLTLVDSDGNPATEGRTAAHVLAVIAQTVEDGRDPFLRVEMDPKMSIGNVRKLYSVLMSIEGDNGVRLEPPGTGEIYQEAFFPDEDWLDPAKRVGDPWEVYLTRRDGKLHAGVRRLVDEEDGGGRHVEMFRVDSAEALAKLLKQRSTQWSRTMFVFASPSMTYGELRDFVLPSMQTHPTVYIFNKTPGTTAPTSE